MAAIHARWVQLNGERVQRHAQQAGQVFASWKADADRGDPWPGVSELGVRFFRNFLDARLPAGTLTRWFRVTAAVRDLPMSLASVLLSPPPNLPGSRIAYRVVQVVLGLFLLAAAGLKAHGLCRLQASGKFYYLWMQMPENESWLQCPVLGLLR